MLLSFPPLVALLALVLLAIHLLRCLTSPLRKIPGPLVSRLTSLVLRYREMKGSRTSYIHDLHRRYGPVVRVAPDEVSFTSWPALKEIYCSGGSGYDKTDFYDLFKIFGRRTMFTQLDKAGHAKRKRLLADRYANSNVLKTSSLGGIQERAARFVERCCAASGGTSDIYVRASSSLSPDTMPGVVLTVTYLQMALHAYACDCVTHHLFHPFGTDCLRQKEDEEMMHQVAADDSLQNRLISHHAPLVHLLFSNFLALFIKPRETPLADNYVLQTSSLSNFAPFTLMSRLADKTDHLDPTATASECLDHMAAGIDTTGDGLCFLMWELSQPRSLRFQQRLAQELRDNPGVADDQLPFLEAVIWEGLRCYPPIPMSLPRRVPEGGRSIDGFWVPGGTTVSCQPWSVQRLNDDVFPEPERFDPDRWLEGEGEGDAERKRMLFAFSNGGRGCIGKHLALAEMKALLRSVYSAFQTTANESMKEELMALSEQLISARPLGQRCLLDFHPLETKGS